MVGKLWLPVDQISNEMLKGLTFSRSRDGLDRICDLGSLIRVQHPNR